MTTGDKGKLFILFVPLFTLSLLSKIACSLWPQYGKDMCDMILYPMKAAVRPYCNEGHDIVIAQNMQIGLKETWQFFP